MDYVAGTGDPTGRGDWMDSSYVGACLDCSAGPPPRRLRSSTVIPLLKIPTGWTMSRWWRPRNRLAAAERAGRASRAVLSSHSESGRRLGLPLGHARETRPRAGLFICANPE